MNNTTEGKLDELLETVRFIKDNASTQESVDDLGKRIEDVENNLTKKIEGVKDDLTKKIEGVENELSGLRSEVQSVKDEILSEIKRLEDKTQSDNDALVRDYVKLMRRVEVLENQFKRFQAA